MMSKLKPGWYSMATGKHHHLINQSVSRDDNVIRSSKNPRLYVDDAMDFVELGKDAIRRNEIIKAQKWYKMALEALKYANSISGGKWTADQDRVKAQYAAIVLSRRRVL